MMHTAIHHFSMAQAAIQVGYLDTAKTELQLSMQAALRYNTFNYEFQDTIRMCMDRLIALQAQRKHLH